MIFISTVKNYLTLIGLSRAGIIFLCRMFFLPGGGLLKVQAQSFFQNLILQIHTMVEIV